MLRGIQASNHQQWHDMWAGTKGTAQAQHYRESHSNMEGACCGCVLRHERQVPTSHMRLTLAPDRHASQSPDASQRSTQSVSLGVPPWPTRLQQTPAGAIGYRNTLLYPTGEMQNMGN